MEGKDEVRVLVIWASSSQLEDDIVSDSRVGEREERHGWNWKDVNRDGTLMSSRERSRFGVDGDEEETSCWKWSIDNLTPSVNANDCNSHFAKGSTGSSDECQAGGALKLVTWVVCLSRKSHRASCKPRRLSFRMVTRLGKGGGLMEPSDECTRSMMDLAWIVRESRDVSFDRR